jgi:hypothetical protein
VDFDEIYLNRVQGNMAIELALTILFFLALIKNQCWCGTGVI